MDFKLVGPEIDLKWSFSIVLHSPVKVYEYYSAKHIRTQNRFVFYNHILYYNWHLAILCGLDMPHDVIDLVNIGSGNDLLPDGMKPLSEPMLTYHQMCFVVFIWEQSHKKCSWTLSITGEIMQLLPNLPGANELTRISLKGMTSNFLCARWGILGANIGNIHGDIN